MKRNFSKPLIIILIFLLIPWMSLVLFDFIQFKKGIISEPSICFTDDTSTNYGIGYSISKYSHPASSDNGITLGVMEDEESFNLLYIIKIPR